MPFHNTRFNPSISGPIHLGAVYCVLVNEHYAHDSGGRFVVRFADLHAPSLTRIGRARMARIVEGMIDDLAWLGILVDAYHYESLLITDIHARLKNLSESFDFPLPPDPPHEPHGYAQTPYWLGGATFTYPYTPTLTAEKVLMDYDEGCDTLIRGEELATEYSLYCYYCEVMNIPAPCQIFIPRLRATGGTEIGKSFGTSRLCDLRAEGFTAKEVRTKLEIACLRNPANGWSLTNIKENPML